MANPVDPGTFDVWYGDRRRARVAAPKTGDTGTFDVWITDRRRVRVFTKAVQTDLPPTVFVPRRVVLSIDTWR